MSQHNLPFLNANENVLLEAESSKNRARAPLCLGLNAAIEIKNIRIFFKPQAKYIYFVLTSAYIF